MKKIGLKRLGIFAVSALSIALTSCGGSSGGGEEEIDFEQKDLVNKYWYHNRFANAAYDASDVLLVYKFEGNSFETKGTLVKQQFSGRVDQRNVGTWQLIDDKLTIIDNTIAGSPTQEWYLRNGSSSSNLKLRGAGDLGGDRDFYSEITGYSDVTADAFYTRVKNSDGSVNNYIGYEVSGKHLKRVVAMPNKDYSYELVRSEEFVKINGVDSKRIVFRLNKDELDYLDEFKGEDEIKFYIELSDGTRLKLNENLPGDEINSLDYYRDFSPETHTVKWKANLGDGVYYRVEVLDVNRNVVFRSLRQPDNSNGVLALLQAQGEINELSNLNTEDPILIRISAFKYEAGIDPINSVFKDANIQAKTMYSYQSNW